MISNQKLLPFKKYDVDRLNLERLYVRADRKLDVRLQHTDNRANIPMAAALQVFTECWTQYTALLETSDGTLSCYDFVVDVEVLLKRLYKDPLVFRRVHGQLIDNPRARKLKATRAAIGVEMLYAGLWPCRNYFQERGE